MIVGDSDNKIRVEKEFEKERQEAEHKEHEAEILVGTETREAIKEAVIPSGEVSEKEKKAQEGYAGPAVSGTAAQGAAIKISTLPSLKVMKKEVERSLKKEMKELRKKIRHIMDKGGPVEAYQLNGLIAYLRRLQEILASLAHATGEFIKDLWLKYVKKEIV
ncbi:hypothetical protein JW911_03140 [Candidatus Peregrinibacteria bacterium]|nr:hypothetical protein [Candidatus Peregrinibacteria bacterium]